MYASGEDSGMGAYKLGGFLFFSSFWYSIHLLACLFACVNTLNPYILKLLSFPSLSLAHFFRLIELSAPLSLQQTGDKTDRSGN